MTTTERPAEILLIEDSPNDVELTLHAFKKAHLPCPIHVAHDGEEALDFLLRNDGEWLQNAKSRLILLDLKLPKIDGLEVLRQIKQHPLARYIPLVVLTSSREERDIRESYALGANSYIVKPVEFERFVEAVQCTGQYWLVLNQVSERRPLGGPA